MPDDRKPESSPSSPVINSPHYRTALCTDRRRKHQKSANNLKGDAIDLIETFVPSKKPKYIYPSAARSPFDDAVLLLSKPGCSSDHGSVGVGHGEECHVNNEECHVKNVTNTDIDVSSSDSQSSSQWLSRVASDYDHLHSSEFDKCISPATVQPRTSSSRITKPKSSDLDSHRLSQILFSSPSEAESEQKSDCVSPIISSGSSSRSKKRLPRSLRNRTPNLTSASKCQSFDGFQTAGGSKLAVSMAAVERARVVYENVPVSPDVVKEIVTPDGDVPPRAHLSSFAPLSTWKTCEGGQGGFKTGSGNSVLVSEKALKSANRTYQSISSEVEASNRLQVSEDSSKSLTPGPAAGIVGLNSLNSIDTPTFPQGHRPLSKRLKMDSPVSAAYQLTTSKVPNNKRSPLSAIIESSTQATSTQSDDFDFGAIDAVVNELNGSDEFNVGFSTGRGKPVDVSDRAQQKAQTLFGDVCEKIDEEMKSPIRLPLDRNEFKVPPGSSSTESNTSLLSVISRNSDAKVPRASGSDCSVNGSGSEGSISPKTPDSFSMVPLASHRPTVTLPRQSYRNAGHKRLAVKPVIGVRKPFIPPRSVSHSC